VRIPPRIPHNSVLAEFFFWQHSISEFASVPTMKTFTKKSARTGPPQADFSASLAGYEKSVAARMKAMRTAGFARRFWARDVSLWAADDKTAKAVGNRLGWLSVMESMRDDSSIIRALISESRAAGYTHALLLGMGGSSLCPEVLRQTFGRQPGYLDLAVLDSTDPQAVREAAGRAPLERTLFLVSTKSGSTIETSSFFEYFYAQLAKKAGARAGCNFVAITDPGSQLIAIAQDKGFRRTYQNPADIGGRYSALSYFGLVPAALMGIDVNRLLAGAMALLPYSPGARSEDHPAIQMGAILGELALQGRNKVTLALSSEIASFGCWTEQLLAESTGKQGRGLFPVDGEPLPSPADCPPDRVFVQMKLAGNADAEADRRLRALEKAGHPVLRIQLRKKLDVGREFFRWEIATAVASHVLGVNSFDEPNVSESKANSGRLLKQLSSGKGAERKPLLKSGGVQVWGKLPAQAGKTPRQPQDLLAAQFSRIQPGGYLAILAYITPSPAHDKLLARLRLTLRNALGVATSVGYGPRYLHSTGQYHKGGPASGGFLLISCASKKKLPIPGQNYGFETLIRAQALGDLEALESRDLPALHVELGGAGISGGLRLLNNWATAAARALRNSRR
jgi:transaldolase/glucose-6-phosphate isomerase